MVKSTLGIVGRLDAMASGSGLRCLVLGVLGPGRRRRGGQAQGKLGWNWKQEKEVPRQKGIIDANRSDRGMHDENVSATEMMEALRRAEVRSESGRTAGRNNKQKGTGLLRRRRCMCEGRVINW